MSVLEKFSLGGLLPSCSSRLQRERFTLEQKSRRNFPSRQQDESSAFLRELKFFEVIVLGERNV